MSAKKVVIFVGAAWTAVMVFTPVLLGILDNPVSSGVIINMISSVIVMWIFIFLILKRIKN